MKTKGLVPNSVTYGCLVDACVKGNMVDRALEVFDMMKRDKVPANTIIYTTIIKGFSKTKRLTEALDLFSSMRSRENIKPNNVTYNSILDCCIRCSNFALAK